MTRTQPLRVLSLFAGIGGIDLGLERIGCTTVAYSEVDPYACRVMAERFPDAVNLGDITTIDWEDVRGYDIDIIAGGFPCQDISIAGSGAGIGDDTRSGLWRHYADAIRILRPRGVLVENVAALTRNGMGRVLGDLAACGFDADWDCVPAAALGAPHCRDRVFILAYPNTAGSQGLHDEGIRVGLQPFARPVRREWEAEPVLDRVANGIPKRVDRLRCLGNAVVPQVAEHVGRILLERMAVAA